jgi:hypothetical protein
LGTAAGTSPQVCVEGITRVSLHHYLRLKHPDLPR